IEQIVCSIDLISQPKQLSNLKNHNPKKDGLIVRSLDGRLGLLLPDLDGVDTVEKQFLICCTKGGINPKVDTPILYQFQVERHKEK
ncbi:MAG: AMMECR1 domain-containing protein, partial [Candidatus Aenigmarchaeota archaeon]|nr:AMMECR1 domain-containing protein [Candidatus Aenigmarchaeota archaeon]